jgi:prepilin peptidase CpaA
MGWLRFDKPCRLGLRRDGGCVSNLAAGALGLLLVSAGIEDARSRNIANWKNAAIALLAPAWWWANGLALWPDVAMQFGVASLVFAFFVGAFAIGQMGGGDVKMLGALALWLPVQPLIYMLVLMSLLGGALTIVMVADRWTRLRGGLGKLPWRTIAPILAAAAAAAILVYSSRLSVARVLIAQPVTTVIVAMTLVAGWACCFSPAPARHAKAASSPRLRTAWQSPFRPCSFFANRFLTSSRDA